MNQYGYFIGCLIVLSVWSVFFLWRKDLRREMIWAGLTGAPLGVTEFWFIPEYWNPPSLFRLADKVGFGIEDIIYSFLAASIAGVIYEIAARRRTVRASKKSSFRWLPYIILLLLYFILEAVFPSRTIYNSMIAAGVAALIIIITRRDLFAQTLFGGFAFGILYYILFSIFNLLLPNYVREIYTLENFWGISLLGVPLEEILFAFGLGVMWSSLYEYVMGYETKPIGFWPKVFSRFTR